MILTIIISLFKNNISVNGTNKNQQNFRIMESETQRLPTIKSNKHVATEVEKLSERFCLVLKLMNEERGCLKFTIAKLAEIMGLQKICREARA
ncbi:MAG: hypothetical protein ACI8TE_001169 [Francisella sp.]